MCIRDRVKPLSVILRGLDAHTDPQEILLELRELGYPVQAIFPLFTNSETRVPLPLVRLHLEKGQAADKIFHLTRLFGFRVRVESSRPPGKLAQCHRCQRFGHHTDVCRSAPACLRCSLRHSTQACTVADKSYYRCINCGEGHAANYSNCPVYRAELLRKQKPQGPLPKPRQPKTCLLYTSHLAEFCFSHICILVLYTISLSPCTR